MNYIMGGETRFFGEKVGKTEAGDGSSASGDIFPLVSLNLQNKIDSFNVLFVRRTELSLAPNSSVKRINYVTCFIAE